MSGIRRSTTLAPTAETYVKSAIGHVGVASYTAGYLPHAMFIGVVKGIYEISKSGSVWLVRRTMENSRRKALKRQKNQ